MATTWKKLGSETSQKIRNAHATCTTGTEAAPTLATEGLDLFGITSYAVYVETSGAAFTVGTLFAYLFNPVSGKWARCPGLDVAVAAGATNVAGISPPNIPTFGKGTRLAFLPNALTSACVVDINGVPLYNVPLQ